MASYPTALWKPSHIVDGTIMVSALFNDLAAEIDAIEAELGIDPHGSAGSLAERVDLFVDKFGGVPNLKNVQAADGQRRRIRAGVNLINVDELTAQSRSARGTLTFSPPLSPLKLPAFALLDIQTMDGDDLGNKFIPSYVVFVDDSGTTTSFDFRVGSADNGVPAAGSQFLLHWLAFDNAVYTGDGDLP